jgi:glycosyltransferase involved in cell wall biosynthesis
MDPKFAIDPATADDPKSEVMGMRHIVETGSVETCPGHDAEYPYGIVYRGPWETEWYGVQTSVRRHARALAKTGMPVWLTSVNHRMEYIDEDGKICVSFADHSRLAPSVKRDVGRLTSCEFKQPLLAIEHRIFSPETIMGIVYPPKLGSLDPAFVRRVNATTILFTVFERSEPDEETRQVAFALACLAEVWVPCKRNRRVLIESGVPEDKVVVMPHPIPEGDPVWTTPRRPPKGVVRLINIGKWEPRKAQHELIGAFLQLFTTTANVELVIKYSDFDLAWKDYPSCPQESIETWLANDAVKRNGWTMENVGTRIRLFKQFLPREAMVRFLAESHIYVSSGRAEGFDMPALDAKIIGLRLVVMGHGGAEDFCTSSDVDLRGLWRTAPAHPGYGWRGARWSGHGVGDFMTSLRTAVDMELNNEPRVPIDVTPYKESTVGQAMLERCLRIVNSYEDGIEFTPAEEYRNA